MTQIAFIRGAPVARSAVQLQYLRDNTGRGVVTDSDQVVATLGRFERGPIDRAFDVDSSNRTRRLGASGSLLASALNEPHLQAYEMLDRGAAALVVSRLVPAAAVNKYLIATQDAATKAITWSTAAALPADFLVAIKHLECFNDGVRVSINAVAALAADGVTAADATVIKLRLIDIATGDALFDDFVGSLVATAKDEFGQSYFLPSRVSSLTDLVEVTVKGTSVGAASNAYGVDASEADKWVTADLNYFSEGGTTYAMTDYDAAISRLFHSNVTFGYLHAGGTANVALIGKLGTLAKRMNKKWAFDVPSSLTTVAAAVAFMANLGLDDHYADAYWAPLVCDDPLNGGKASWGASGVNLGLRCQRNAQTNGDGVAPKHFAVAGSDWSLGRTGVRQLLNFEDTDMEKLAKAKINLVAYENYASGGKYAFLDSLTCSKSSGDKQLSTVSEMATAVDDAVTRYAKECLQKPIDVAIANLTTYLEQLFKALQRAGWLVASDALKGAAWRFSVTPNSASPKQKIDVSYDLSYQGTARVITVAQTLSK
jgi:hypothetical protein